MFTEITNFIQSVGFPIVMSIILLKYMKDNDDRHDDEVSALRTAIENNTTVLQKVVDKIEHLES